MSDIPKLLPLEYCTIERAAKMLRCEVEDIQHWIDINAITAYAIFNGERSYQGILTTSAAQELSKDETLRLPEPFKLTGVANTITLDDGSKLQSLPFSFNGVINELNEPFYGVPTGFWQLISAKSFTDENTTGYSFCPQSFELSESGQLNYLKSTTFLLHLEDEQLPELYILQKDLKRLYEAIYENKPLKNTLNDAEKAQEQLKNNQQAKAAKEHHKTKNAEQLRAEIIDFASDIFLADKNSVKPEITSAAKWVEKVNDQALKRWDDGEPPLSNDRMTRTLGPVYRAIIKCTEKPT
ncbi:hypothetical protein ACGRL8_08310 [Vibrio rumoiensis]|uniref:hypothetical protein n=1 Tax=Vibrio rumoiensis TaxID=76258 RepID=UPI0037491DCE